MNFCFLHSLISFKNYKKFNIQHCMFQVSKKYMYFFFFKIVYQLWFFREWFAWIFWKITGAQLWLFPRFFSPSVHFWQTAIQVFEVICQLATWILIRAPVYINIICWKFTLKPDCLQYIIFESLPQSCCFHAIQQSMYNYIILLINSIHSNFQTKSKSPGLFYSFLPLKLPRSPC